MIVADYTIVQDDYFAPPKVLKFSLPSDFFLGSGAVLSFVVQTKQANSLVYRVLVNGQALMMSGITDGDNQFAIHEVIDAGKFGLVGGGPHQVSFEIFSGSAFGSYFSDVLITYKADRT